MPAGISAPISQSPCSCIGSRPRARRWITARATSASAGPRPPRSATRSRRSAKPWIKHATALDRGKKPAAGAQARREPVTFQDAAFAAMADAYKPQASRRQVSGPLAAGVLQGAAQDPRADRQGRARVRATAPRFCYTLLPLFMQENPELTAPLARPV